MNKHAEVILEDKAIYGLNKVHKNVLRSSNKDYCNAKARVVHTSLNEDQDDIPVNTELMHFVTDGIRFDKEVVKTKAKHALPYNPRDIKEILENKHDLGNEIFLVKRSKPVTLNKYQNNMANFLKLMKKPESEENQQLAIEGAQDDYEALDTDYALVKFKPKIHFAQKSTSTENLTGVIREESDLGQNSKSCEDLADNIEVEGIFITETQSATISVNKVPEKKPKKVVKKPDLNENSLELQHVEKVRVKWDDHLIDQLSENTARWIAMKNTSDFKQKKKLIDLVEQKYGKYTHRDVKDLELFEYNLTTYEKKKIAEEKRRIQMEKEQRENPVNSRLEEEVKEVPMYRLPAGLKREAIYKLQLPDKSHNKTAGAVTFAPTDVNNPQSYEDRMTAIKATPKTILQSKNEYEKDMIAAGGKLKHEFIHNNHKKIELSDGKTFVKNTQPVFPAEFTAWISSVDLVPNDRPEMTKPVKGKKRWTDYPKLIDDTKIQNPYEQPQSYWNLMPTTPDSQLKRIAKSNLTVAKIVDEWRKKWQTTSHWTIAEIEELIMDMNDESPNIRFQAVVICTRAVERIQVMIDKLRAYDKKFPKRKGSAESGSTLVDDITGETLFKRIDYDDTENLIFSAKLFETIEKLLTDTNQKVKLSAAIAVFIILRSFQRPMLEKKQRTKDYAEVIVREHLYVRSKSDRYTAAQCLAIDGYCEEAIIEILLVSYFQSCEQFTKQQVSRTLSDLSRYHELVLDMVASYLKSEHERERILACKLIPCLRRSIPKHVSTQLSNLMWNDLSRKVKKVASQTLGRVGRGRDVHEEIYQRLVNEDTFQKIEALRKINTIGIMTDKLLKVYLHCFRDEHTTVRELACRSSQCLFQNYDKLIDSLVFMVKYDPVNRLKAMAISALSLIGNKSLEIRKSLLWSLQFEVDPSIRTEACHCIIILFRNPNDSELMDILQERHLLENEPIVRNEIMGALNQLGYNPNRELPIVTKIRSDVSRMGDKTLILQKIKALDEQLAMDADKKRLLWNESDQIKKEKREKELEEKLLVDEHIDNVSIENLNGGLEPSKASRSSFASKDLSKKKTSKTISFYMEGDEKDEATKSFLEKLIMVEDENNPRNTGSISVRSVPLSNTDEVS